MLSLTASACNPLNFFNAHKVNKVHQKDDKTPK